jgi:flagellin
MDLFKIGSNVASMNALNNLYKLNEKMNVHQSRLSTGKRVNSAQDDVAAFSVAKNIETTRQGYEISRQNIKNAQSVLSIVEAGQQKQLEILQDMKNKVVQIQDSTLNTDQRQSLIDAVTALKNELVAVSSQMTFNGTTVASGAGAALSFRVGAGTTTGATSADVFAVTSTVISATSSISTSSASNSANTVDITNVQTLIDSTLTRIANTGSAIERLKHKEDIVSAQAQNHEAVRSTYEDADFAKEQMELMKVQILQQTATAALAQANSAPQLVLSMFR